METALFSYLDAPSQPATPAAGPLSGINVVIQPSISVRGWPTEAGCTALKGYQSLDDATAVSRLRAAGASLTGRSRMSELGFGLDGDTMETIMGNGDVPMGLMIDMMGEGRVTAAGAGVFAFKPTFGIVSRFGLIGLVPSMECLCVIARGPADMAKAVQTVAGTDENDFSMASEIPPLQTNLEAEEEIRTVGILKEVVETLDGKALASFRAALARIESAGKTIRELSLPTIDLLSKVHQVVGAVEASSSCGKYDGVRYGHRAASAGNWNDMYLKTRSEAFGTTLKAFLFQGAYFQFENYEAFLNACRVRARLVAEMDALMDRADCLALPTRMGEAYRAPAGSIEGIYRAFTLTLPANVTGQPAVQVPHIAEEAGFDTGLQLVGARMSDARLLSLAFRLSHS